ncbi:MAG: hypothetical protein U9O41_08470, partial [Candidatus Aerophobetes bacterium]|nr:hypothetical protein [Candidatus Aerophobetes bacterium]
LSLNLHNEAKAHHAGYGLEVSSPVLIPLLTWQTCKVFSFYLMRKSFTLPSYKMWEKREG